MLDQDLDSIIETALREDLPQGDITSESVVPPESVSEAFFLAKQGGVLAGLEVAARVFQKIDPAVEFQRRLKDGAAIKQGDRLADLRGLSISLLKGERTALNFLQRMSGIATTTRSFVRALAGSRTRVLDTRKTTPGLRVLEKYAVTVGGGVNHRFSLSEMVLLKDNHLRLVGSISEAVRRAKVRVKPGTTIEVETTSLEEVKEALVSGADWIMLDNMTTEEIREVVARVKGRVPIEVSGNINLVRARQIAALGVDYISVGALTHSYRSLDISLEFSVKLTAREKRTR